MKLTHLDQQLCQQLEQEIKGVRREQIIPHLFTLGLFSYKAIEELAIRRHIELLIGRGLSTGGALIETAQHFCCSYEKARNIYYKPKHNHP